ncbi:MAG: tetratricopeptide repeat protein, partial [Deltaproteobacteria bacterium]|nr:tetratricopeptide repeat protein [Deltaproteobacteria bacterium]
MHQVSFARILILALIVFGIAACGKSSNEDLHEARQLLAVGETEQALEAYKKILVDDPHQAEAHRRVAEIYIDQDKIEEAREHVTEAVALAPEDPDTFYVHGRFLLAQKLWLQAGETLEIAARENLFDPDVQFYFAAALAKLGEQEKAIYALLKVQGMKPDYPGVNAGIGDLYFYTGAYDKAMQSYEQAIVETPDDARIIENLALAYHYQKFNDSAEKMAKRALELNPESAGAYNILGAVAFAHRDIDEAEKHFKKAILLDPKLTAPHVNLGAIFNAKGKIDESLAEYQKALELEPGNIPVQKNLGDLYFTKGEISLALEHYRTYHQQRPKDPFVAYVSAKL